MDNICCKPSYKTLALICFLLAAVTVAAFEQVRYCGFVFDDKLYIIDPPDVMMGVTVKSILWALTSGFASNWHPLTWLSHIVDCELFGLDPYWPHLENLLFHIVNVLLLFWVLIKMTNAVWRSAFVAALFAVHPLRVESVAWIAERKDVLSGLFFMLALIFYVGYVKNRPQTLDARPRTKKDSESEVSGLRSQVLYAACLAAYTLGLMSKPMLVTLPFILLLLDYWPLERKTGFGRLVLEKAPLFVLSVISSVVTYMVQRPSIVKLERLPLGVRLSNAVISYLGYISKMIFPVDLAVLYPYPDKFPIWHVVSSLVILLLLTFGIVYLGRQRRYILIGWLWYLVMLVPVIGIVQVGPQAMADRYPYLPSIGFFIIGSWGAVELVSGWRRRRVILGACGTVMVFVLIICTRMQVKYWHDNITLFGHAVEVTSSNYIAHNNLANALVSKGRFEDAVGQYRQMLFLKPDDIRVLSSLGGALKMSGHLDEALVHLNYAIKLDPNSQEANNNIGITLRVMGRFDEALVHYRKVLELNPDYVFSLTGAAKILSEHPDKSKRDVDQAIKFAEHATDLTKYRDSAALEVLAAAYAAAGQFDKAEAAAVEAISLLTSAGDDKQANFVRQKLQTYRQGRQGNR